MSDIHSTRNKLVTDRIHVLDDNISPDDVLRNVVQSGLQENAFFVMDVGDLVNKHLEWKSKLPRVTPFYAVKCNDSQLVLEVLAVLGTGFDCASEAEISKVLDLGVDSSHIIFANPTKIASHIRYARRHNINTITFDNENELYKVKDIFPQARLVLRIRCDAAKASFMLGMKFGCNIVTEAPHLFKLAAELGLRIVGVCFHVGSGCQEPEAFRRAIAAARGLFDLGFELGFTMNLLDIGGGYPGRLDSSFDEIAEVVNKALDDFFPTTSMGDVQVIAEPGTYYVASAYTLATQIHSKKDTMYYITDGLFGSINCNFYTGSVIKPVPLGDKPGKLQSSTVWGPTCDSTDKVVDDVMLPPLDIGDWLIFRNAGAYTLSLGTTFNGFSVAKVIAVISQSIRHSLKDCPPLTEDYFTSNNDLETYLEHLK